MTKNLLILSLFFFTGAKINAQCTPDNNITKPGFYPSSLPDAKVGVAYNEVIQFKIIKDTTVIVFGNPTKATIDSATITDVKGMPDGLTFELNKKSKTYTPAETGCALVKGTPTKQGKFNLQIILMIYAKIGTFGVSQPDTIENFSIDVKSSARAEKIAEKINFIYPNPLMADKLFINPDILTPSSGISIFNSYGQLLDSKLAANNPSGISFNYPKGVYWIGITNGDRFMRLKLVKE